MTDQASRAADRKARGVKLLLQAHELSDAGQTAEAESLRAEGYALVMSADADEEEVAHRVAA